MDETFVSAAEFGKVLLDYEHFRFASYAGRTVAFTPMTQRTISLFFMPYNAMPVLEHASGVVYRNQVLGVLQLKNGWLLLAVNAYLADKRVVATHSALEEFEKGPLNFAGRPRDSSLRRSSCVSRRFVRIRRIRLKTSHVKPRHRERRWVRLTAKCLELAIDSGT
jgi:hypothetical protein